MDYKSSDFNHKGRTILNDNNHASCPWCGFNFIQASDLFDAGEREYEHTCLLQVIEDIDKDGDSWLSFQWECLNCHKNGMFTQKGPRTDYDMVRKQGDAMRREHKTS